MIARPAVALLILALAGLNTPAQTNNPQPAGAGPTAAQAPPRAAAPSERKLSRGERRERIKNLPEKYQQFLREVEFIMMDEELVTFLLLESDAQRELYISQFWIRRDEDPKTSHNEYREQYYERLEEAKTEFKYLSSDRARIFLTKGRPADRIQLDCDRYLQPIEAWKYYEGNRARYEMWVVLYKPRGGGTDFRLWQPFGPGLENLRELLSFGGEQVGVEAVFFGKEFMGRRTMPEIWTCRDGEIVLRAINYAQQNGMEIARKVFTPPKIDVEDVNDILRSIVLANPDAPQMEADMGVRYPGKRGGRTSIEMTLTVPKSSLQIKDLEGSRFYNVDVTGEILKKEKLFENFHYRYDFPIDAPGDHISVVIERFLRPAEYTARIKVLDANSGAEAIVEQELDVPYIRESDERRRSEREGDETVSRLLTEFRSGESQLRIIPLGTELLTGLQKIETLVTGNEIETVEFYLDNTKIMAKRRPPYTLELDFGDVPRLRRVKAIGLDAKGEFVAGDETAVNIGSDPFRVWIQQPRVAMNVKGNVRVEVDARAPEGRKIQRVELWLNESRVATLFEPPYIQTVAVPEDMNIGYLRAVAFLDDPDAQPTEDVVFLNTPEFLEEIDVHLVELPTTVLRGGKPVQNLDKTAFRILDEGTPVEISKFDYVQNLPLSIGLALDASGSMERKMDEAQKAAAQFFKRVLRPTDKAFVVAFDSQAYTVQKWSRNLADLHAGLASLRAEESTALYDALVYSLYHFQGIRGQKALVLISDGKDTASRFSFDQALEYARRAAVPIYAVGIGIRGSEMDVRYKLNQLAEQTGGNTYYIDRADGLREIYTDIENELRAQYLLGFYPPEDVKAGGDWREVEVAVDNGNAKTIKGYYP